MREQRVQIEKLIAAAPKGKPLFLEATDWLFDRSYDEIELLAQEFSRKFASEKIGLIEQLGEPTWTLPADEGWFHRWYPECLQAAAWDRGDRIVCLAVDWHDKETPITLNVQCLTKDELARFAI